MLTIFGFERLGLFAVAKPRAAVAFSLVALTLALIGTTQLRFLDESRALFRGDTPAWHAYEALSADFADVTDAVVLVAEGDFRTPAGLRDLQRLHDRVAADGATADVASIVSLARMARGLAPAPVPGAETAARAAEGGDPLADPRALAAHPLNQGQFLAPDLRHAALILQPAAPLDDVAALRAFEAALAPVLADPPGGLSTRLTGLPVLGTRVLANLVAEQPVLLLAGFAIGFGLGVLLLGRVADAAVIAVVPAVAVAAAYGLIALAGLEMTVLLNNLPLLILALGFADHMHLVYDARRRLAAADHDFAALADTIRHVGPACALSALTTMLAFLSFELSGSAAIREFGRVGALAVAGVFVTCMLVHPAAVWAALRLGWRPVPTERTGHAPVHGFARLAGALAGALASRRLAVAGLGLLAAAALGYGAGRAEPRHTLVEQLPADAPAMRAAGTLDRDLGGLHAIQLPLPVRFEAGAAPVRALARVRRAHSAAVDAFPDRPVLSVAAVVRWLDQAGHAVSPQQLRALLARAPAGLRDAVISRDGTRAQITVRVGGPEQVAPAAARLERAVGAALGVDLGGQASGFAVLAARAAPDVIRRLQVGLIAAAAGAALLMGLAFRSWRVAAIGALPNLLPVLAVGAATAAFGWGLEIAAALAMTVALGIAVDDTVHTANEYAAARRTSAAVPAVARALSTVGPVLVTTTLVLAVGLTPALFSWSPAVATFAGVAIATIALALLADLVLLPALLTWWRGPRGRPG